MTFHQLKKHKIRGEPTKIPSHDFCECRIPPLLILILSKKSPYLSDPHGIQNNPISNPRHFCGSWAKGLGHVRASSNCKQFRARPAKVQVVCWKYGEPTGKKGPYFSMKWLFNSFCCNPWYTPKQPKVFFIAHVRNSIEICRFLCICQAPFGGIFPSWTWGFLRGQIFSGWKNHRCRLNASSNALFKAKEILQAKHEFDRSSAWSSWSSGYLWRMHVSILNSNVLKYPQQTPKTFWCVSCTTTSLWGLFLWLTLKFMITKTGYWANSRNQHYWFQFNCKTS